MHGLFCLYSKGSPQACSVLWMKPRQGRASSVSLQPSRAHCISFVSPQVGEGFIFLCELASLDVFLDVSVSSPFSPATQTLRLQGCVTTPIFNITSFFYDLIGVLCVCTTETRAHDLAHAKPHFPECWDSRSVPLPHLNQGSMVNIWGQITLG